MTSNGLRALSRNAFAIVLAIAGGIVVLVTVVLATHVYTTHDAARQLREGAALSDALLRAAVARAEERDRSAALLAGARDEEQRRRLHAARDGGDRAWAEARTALRGMHEPGSNPALPVQLDRVMETDRAIGRMRLRIDHHAEHGGGAAMLDEWFDAHRRWQVATRQIRDQLLAVARRTGGEQALVDAVQRTNRLVSEEVGILRGHLVFHARAGWPMDDGGRERLHGHRETMASLTDELQALQAQLPVDRALDSALGAAVERLRGLLAETRRMLLGSHDGDYPLSGEAWFDSATGTVDALVHVSEIATADSMERLEGEITRSLLALAGLLGLGGAAGALAWVALARVRATGRELDRHREMAEITLDSITDALVVTGADGRTRHVNPAAELLLDWPGAAALDQDGDTTIDLISRDPGVPRRPIESCLRSGNPVTLPPGTRIRRRDGAPLPVEGTVAPMHRAGGTLEGCVTTLHAQSTWDALTGLFNRHSFERQVQALAMNIASAGEAVLAVADVDRFRLLNDRCGHAHGDGVLRRIAFILREAVGGQATLARLGSDEFGILLPRTSITDGEALLGDVCALARRYPYRTEDRNYDLSLSIGVVALDGDCDNASELLSRADAACVQARERGGDRLERYRAAVDTLAENRDAMYWVSEIIDALQEGRLELAGQPVMDIQNGWIAGREVLVRMRMRDGSLAPPGAFLPPAERHNLMWRIDREVIRLTCELLASDGWQGDTSVTRVNLSGLSLSDDGLVDYIREQAGTHGVAPERLCFEVTETAAVGNIDRAIAFMEALIKDGFTFALDDFGTGAASFAYLRALPVQQLKVDGTFVRRMGIDPVDRAIVESVVRFARLLGVTVTAEFVEDDATLDALREMGVDYGQGFGIGRPQLLAGTGPDGPPPAAIA